LTLCPASPFHTLDFRLVLLYQPLCGKTKMAVVADDEMVQHFERHNARCEYQLARDSLIVLAGSGITRGMVMDKNKLGGVVPDGRFHHLSCENSTSVHRAMGQVLSFKQFILAVEKKDLEYLFLQATHRLVQVAINSLL